MHPRISIIICAFNAGGHLRHSVASALAQTYPSLEVILVDDGSTDGSIEGLPPNLLSDERLHILAQQNTGKPGALNVGINRATGEYLALQDADDISSPDRLLRQLAAFQSNPGLGISFCGHYLIWDENKIAPVEIAVGNSESSLIIQNYGMPGLDPTMMFPRGIAESFPFDEALPIVEGYDFVLRVGEKHPLMNIGECLYGYRILSASRRKHGIAVSRICRRSPDSSPIVTAERHPVSLCRQCQVQCIARQACGRDKARVMDDREMAIRQRHTQGTRVCNHSPGIAFTHLELAQAACLTLSNLYQVPLVDDALYDTAIA
jgi:glycosyltransferase involved in cell wall biosynthesis